MFLVARKLKSLIIDYCMIWYEYKSWLKDFCMNTSYKSILYEYKLWVNLYEYKSCANLFEYTLWVNLYECTSWVKDFCMDISYESTCMNTSYEVMSQLVWIHFISQLVWIHVTSHWYHWLLHDFVWIHSQGIDHATIPMQANTTEINLCRGNWIPLNLEIMCIHTRQK